ncbi:MAG: WD40 repeat domain-containing protein [Bacteroidia bacterium]
MSKINVAKIANFDGHRGGIYSMEFSVNPNCFYSAGSEGFVVEWNSDTKGEGNLIASLGKPVFCIKTDRENKLLYCGTNSGNVHIIDLVEKKEIKNIEAHSRSVFDIKIFEEKIITCGGDGMINILNRKDFSLIKKIKASEKSARVISINKSESMMAVGFSDFKIRIYNSENFELIKVLDRHTNSVFALSFSPDGKFLVSSGRDAMLKVWNIESSFSLVQDIPSHTAQVKCLAYNPSGKLLASSSMDKTIKIWDVSTFELLKVIDKARNDSHTNCINQILWMDENHFVSCSDDKVVMGWRIGNQ